MKKFQFRLQKLLQLRTHKKVERQKELAKAERVRRMEEAHLALLEQRLRDEIADLAPLKVDRLDVRRLTNSIYFQHRLNTNMASQRKAIASAQRQEAIKRKHLIDAARAEKVFIRLKETQQERYLAELDQHIQKEIDEIAQNTFLQRAAKGSRQSPR